MTTFNKSDLMSQKHAGKKYYFFVLENHLGVIALDEITEESLELVTVRNILKYSQIEDEEVTV